MPSGPNQVPDFSPAPLNRPDRPDKLKDAIELLQSAANPNPKPTLVERFGAPAALNTNKQISGLNEPFWAGHYRDHQPETIYEPKEDKFYSYDALSGLFLHTTENYIRKTISEHILDASRQWPNQGLCPNFAMNVTFAALSPI
jgi:hypothetical protein